MVTPYTNGDHAAVEARRWKAVTLQNRGLTLPMIAREMQEDYRRHNPNLTLIQIENHIGIDVHRALKEYRKRVDRGIEEKITQQELRFADIRRRLYSIIAANHFVTNNGKIIKDDDGVPIRDHGPIIAALAQLRLLEDQEARLHGTYSSEKISLALERRVDDEAVEVVEAILAGFSALPELEPAHRQRALEAAGAHLRTIQGEVVDERDDQ